MSRATPALERLAIVAAAIALTVGLIALLSGFFAGRDSAGLSGSAATPGVAYADLGHAHLRPGQPRPRYSSDPPTSGAHRAVPVPANLSRPTDDGLLEGLELGDVFVLYGSSRPPAGLAALARSVAPYSPALAQAGQAVILGRRPGTAGVTALAWAHMLRASSPGDARLRGFLSFWLGRGATSRCC